MRKQKATAKKGQKLGDVSKKTKTVFSSSNVNLKSSGTDCDKTADCAVSGNYTPQSAVYC